MASSFPERLKHAREAVGWNPDEAGEMGDTSRSTVYNWEAGRGAPTPTYLARLAEAGVSLEWLLLGRGEMRPVPPEEAQQRLRLIRVAMEAEDVPALVELFERLEP